MTYSTRASKDADGAGTQPPLQPSADATPADGAAGEGFEAVYARLEAVSQQLEAGGLTLEQSLALYEEGMALAQQAQALLAAAEQRIETLRQAAGGPDGRGA